MMVFFLVLGQLPQVVCTLALQCMSWDVQLICFTINNTPTMWSSTELLGTSSKCLDKASFIHHADSSHIPRDYTWFMKDLQVQLVFSFITHMHGRRLAVLSQYIIWVPQLYVCSNSMGYLPSNGSCSTSPWPCPRAIARIYSHESMILCSQVCLDSLGEARNHTQRRNCSVPYSFEMKPSSLPPPIPRLLTNIGSSSPQPVIA